MTTLRQAAAEFLSHDRIAVAGVSHDRPNAGNIIYKRLRSDGYQVFAVNPNADTVEGDRCYHDLGDIEGGVDGVVIATAPAASISVVQDCVRTHTPRVWLHRSFGAGSVAQDAVALCEREGIDVIAGACPMMFVHPADVGHACMRWVLGVTGRLPQVGERSTLERLSPRAAPGRRRTRRASLARFRLTRRRQRRIVRRVSALSDDWVPGIVEAFRQRRDGFVSGNGAI